MLTFQNVFSDVDISALHSKIYCFKMLTVQHGEAEDNVTGRVGGDSSLTPQGILKGITADASPVSWTI